MGLTAAERVVGESITKVELPAHLQVVALRLEGDPYEPDFERLMKWIQGSVKPTVLSRGRMPSHWGEWRADWVPDLVEQPLEPAPLLFSSDNVRMQQLVQTYSIPALKVELRQWTTEALGRISSSIRNGAHRALFLREPAGGRGKYVTALEPNTALDLVCVLSDQAPDEELVKTLGAEFEYVREIDEGLPWVVTFRGVEMKHYVELVSELRAGGVSYPFEAAFLKVLQMYLLRKPPGWDGYLLPGKLTVDVLTQAAVRRRIWKRHGILTNVVALHALARHCDGSHTHKETEAELTHGKEFAAEYVRLALRDKELTTIKFVECWGNILTEEFRRKGVQVADPVPPSHDASELRESLTTALVTKQVTLLHFWLPHGPLLDDDHQLWVVTRLCEEARRNGAGASLGRPWPGPALQLKEPYWWMREERETTERGYEPPGRGFALITYDLCCFGTAVAKPAETTKVRRGKLPVQRQQQTKILQHRLADSWKVQEPCRNMGAEWKGRTLVEKQGGSWHQEEHGPRRVLWTPLELPLDWEQWTGRRITYLQWTGAPPADPVPVVIREDTRVSVYQGLPEGERHQAPRIERRVTRDGQTGEVFEDYRGYDEAGEAWRPRRLVRESEVLVTEFYEYAPSPAPPHHEVEWVDLHSSTAATLRGMFDERGREGVLTREELARLEGLGGPEWELNMGKFRYFPNRFQVAEVEELPRRACYRDATVGRVTILMGEGGAKASSAEQIRLPAGEWERREFHEGAIQWSLTLFGGATGQARLDDPR